MMSWFQIPIGTDAKVGDIIKVYGCGDKFGKVDEQYLNHDSNQTNFLHGPEFCHMLGGFRPCLLCHMGKARSVRPFCPLQRERLAVITEIGKGHILYWNDPDGDRHYAARNTGVDGLKAQIEFVYEGGV